MTDTDVPPSKLAQLISLAQEPSSAKRRELLREITDLFFATVDQQSVRALALFDDVLLDLTREMETEVRAALSERIADAPRAPVGLVRSLANDEIAVAAPVLSRSPVLVEDDLLNILQKRGQDYLRAVSRRVDLPDTVSDVIVERGDDTTLGVLLRNGSAMLSRRSAETVVDRATANVELHDAVVNRLNLPIDLLNEMYFVVEAGLRETIMARNASISPAELSAALETSRKRIATRDGALPPDLAEAERYVSALVSRKQINPSVLVSFLRFGERTRFLVALAQLSEIDFNTARMIVDRKQIDALAIVCKAASFDRAIFLTFTLLIQDDDRGMGRAHEYVALYNQLDVETAKRTLRFWRMRRDTGDVAA
jgi:uncharacterized protein (DUF2336 family)